VPHNRKNAYEEFLRPPIFSEGQYFDTYKRSLTVLSQVFDKRNILLLGTSIMDPPLVSALLNTKQSSSANSRMAIMPLQSGKFYMTSTAPTPSPSLCEWSTERLRELGTKAIYPDFYFQVGQLFHEAQMCIAHGDRDSMSIASSSRRYGSRVECWWSKWFKKNCGLQSTQAKHHQLLADELAQVREALRSPINESLKLEAWSDGIQRVVES
jgi:hypothetical protein